MNYILETPEMETKFSELKCGEVFYHKWGDDPEYRHFYIKICEAYEYQIDSFDINTNSVHRTLPNEPVYKVHSSEFKITV